LCVQVEKIVQIAWGSNAPPDEDTQGLLDRREVQSGSVLSGTVSNAKKRTSECSAATSSVPSHPSISSTYDSDDMLFSMSVADKEDE
jgi:hypothetical protein